MQPYLLPYVGYFQLIEEADVFILLDDVQYIRRGWVNRNRVLLHGQPHAIRLPIAKASRSTAINKIQIADDAHQYLSKQKTMIHHAYGASSGWAVVQQVSTCITDNNLNGALLPVLKDSIQQCCKYLGIQRSIVMASDLGGEELRGDQRILHLLKAVGGTRYINLPGGVELYNDSLFGNRGIELKFLLPKLRAYPQIGVSDFVPALSVLDILASREPGSNRLDIVSGASLVSREELINLSKT